MEPQTIKYLLYFILFWLFVGMIVVVIVFVFSEFREYKQRKQAKESLYNKKYDWLQTAIGTYPVDQYHFSVIEMGLIDLEKVPHENHEKTEVLRQDFRSNSRFKDIAKQKYELHH